MALDGYNRQQVLSFNGTVPGPLIWADWGDNLIIRKPYEVFPFTSTFTKTRI